MEPPPPPTDDEKAVLEVFDRYRRAVLEDDASTALACASRPMVRYYEHLRQQALYRPAETLPELPFFDRFMVYVLRARFSAEDLLRSTAAGLFKHAVAHGWTGKPGVMHTDIQEVAVQGDEAIGTLGASGAGTARMRFLREQGVWRVDFTPLLMAASEAVTRQFPDAATQAERLDTLLRETVPEADPDAVRDPLVPPDPDDEADAPA
jgi:hypothetical protein